MQKATDIKTLEGLAELLGLETVDDERSATEFALVFAGFRLSNHRSRHRPL